MPRPVQSFSPSQTNPRYTASEPAGMLQLPHCKRHFCALRAGHACRCVAVPPPPLQPPDWPAKVIARSAGGRSLAVTCYWRHNLRRSSLHWTKRWTGLNLTLRVNDRYPKFWYFVKRPYWWISALGLKCKVWKFGTNWAKSEEVIAKNRASRGLKSIGGGDSCRNLNDRQLKLPLGANRYRNGSTSFVMPYIMPKSGALYPECVQYRLNWAGKKCILNPEHHLSHSPWSFAA